MTFEENPFRVLQVSIYADKVTINERADELSFEDPDREEIIEQARTILLNPKKRIAAEVCSLVDNDIFRDLNIFYLANIFSTDNNIHVHLLNIDKKFSAQNSKIIREQINAARAKSKFPAVQDTTAIKSELKNIRYEVREKIQDLFKSMPREEQVKFSNDLASLLDDEENFGVIVEDFFDSYRLEMNPFLEDMTKQIIEACETKFKFEFKAEFSQFLYEVEPVIKNFVEMIKPLDKFSIALGKNNFNESENIFYAVRDVAIKLFNEKNLIDYPLKIIQILEHYFFYLPTLAELIRKDINFLETAKARRPTKSFLDAKAALDKIQASMNENLHFEKGFEDKNLDFYLHFFRATHEVTLKRLMFRQDMKLEDWRILNTIVAVIYIQMGTAMTWTHFHPKTVLELFQKALPYATDSNDKELISIAYKKVDEWRKINERIYGKSKESSWNFKLLFAISIIVVLWLIVR